MKTRIYAAPAVKGLNIHLYSYIYMTEAIIYPCQTEILTKWRPKWLKL